MAVTSRNKFTDFKDVKFVIKSSGKQSRSAISHKSDNKSDNKSDHTSVVTIAHEQNIICSKNGVKR